MRVVPRVSAVALASSLVAACLTSQGCSEADPNCLGTDRGGSTVCSTCSGISYCPLCKPGYKPKKGENLGKGDFTLAGQECGDMISFTCEEDSTGDDSKCTSSRGRDCYVRDGEGHHPHDHHHCLDAENAILLVWMPA